MPKLEDLATKLLFQNTIDVWIALCEEKGWKWFDVDSYLSFLDHLTRNGVSIKTIGVCPTESGEKYRLAEEASRRKGEVPKATVVKMSGDTIRAARRYGGPETGRSQGR